MFCPYVRKSYLRATAIHYNEDVVEDGSLVFEKYENQPCKKEECGVWNNGKCNYTGRDLNV